MNFSSWLVGFFCLDVWALYTKPYSLLGCPGERSRVTHCAFCARQPSVETVGFPLFTAARCPNSLGCQSLPRIMRLSSNSAHEQPHICHQPSTQRHGITMTGGECRSIISPKSGRCSKPPNMRGRGLLVRWPWITVKNDRLFHISQISQISGRPIFLSLVAYSAGKDR